jgi:glucose-1-phosphate cytidylyltransferase
MKAVILAGGLGTRLSEETNRIPKPMVEIGGMPILWHIMKIYSAHNINEFIICCGYRGYVIKEFFSNYFLHNSDITFNVEAGSVTIHNKKSEPWKVTCVDTGESTETGGRLRKIREFLSGEKNFCFTYGDGLSNINIGEVIRFHEKHGKLATISAVSPPGRYGAIECSDDDAVIKFTEKPLGDNALINGGYFVLSTDCLDLIEGDLTVWEKEPLNRLTELNQIAAFRHYGFWQAMDTLREKKYLDEMWRKNNAPWKVW